MRLSVREQIEAMRMWYPGFRVISSCSWLVSWEGVLRPLSQSYTVQIFYVRRYKIGDCEMGPCRHLSACIYISRGRFDIWMQNRTLVGVN